MVLRSCRNGCGLESEKVQEMHGVSEGRTNGTWLQLVRSCAVPIDCGVPDLRGGSDGCAGWVGVSDAELHYKLEDEEYMELTYNIRTELLDLMCELKY